jgi:hypothetical protein
MSTVTGIYRFAELGRPTAASGTVEVTCTVTDTGRLPHAPENRAMVRVCGTARYVPGMVTWTCVGPRDVTGRVIGVGGLDAWRRAFVAVPNPETSIVTGVAELPA